jgi:hypothetical protein
VIEYDVAIAQYDPKSGVNISTIRNCKVDNLFGSRNNNLTYTLVSGTQDDSDVYSNTSIVLILCINGVTDAGSAVIIGALANDKGPSYTKDNGQFYDFNFNGINYNINKDGEWTITFNSVLDDEGKPTNKDAAGTAIKINKDGVITISDNEGQSWNLNRKAKTSTWTNGAESIVIDKGNKSVTLKSTGEMSQKSEKAMNIESGDVLAMKSKADTTIDSSANLTVSASNNVTVKSGGAWNIQASGNVNIQAGGNLMMQGSGMAQLQAAINMLGTGSFPIAIAGISQCIGVTNIPGLPTNSIIISGSATCLAGA